MGNKLLIADDSKLVLSLVKSIFEGQDADFTVITAVDGRDAVEKAEKELPDIILMDWQMPEMDGIQALEIIRAHQDTKDIPVLMLTASESTGDAYELGANDFIQKPFNKSELLARVNTSLKAVNLRKDLKQRNIDYEIQRDKLKIQKDFLVKQKKELAENKDLATQVHKLLLPSQNLLNTFFKESFVLSVPLAEIPSNFYWTSKKGNVVFFCIGLIYKEGVKATLTSAGIMGALNELISKAETDVDLNPSNIMNALRTRLNEEGCKGTEPVPCPDIVLCSIDQNKNTLQYSGINIPVYVMKNGKLVELKTEKGKEGFTSANFEFSNHKVQLAEGDLIYILNDGFNENKSVDEAYISEEILNLFRKIYIKELSKQSVLLDKTFAIWKKDLKQVKDILIMGIKV
jgi:phosphoserine phosphatase RsbU/P